MLNSVGHRKQRIDKKRDVKPTVKIELKDAIYRLAFITRATVKDVAERMIEYAVRDQQIIGELSKSFRRNIRMNSTLYRGHIDNERFERHEQGRCERLTTRLTQKTYENVSVLAYALDLNPTRVCALLLNMSMHNFCFLNTYVGQYLKNELSPSQLKELREMLRYINQDMEEMTLASLLSVIVDEVNAPVNQVKDAVDEFIIHNWRK